MFISLKQFFVICFVLLKTVSGTPVGFRAANGRFFVVEINPVTNEMEAFHLCEAHGGKLVSLDTAEKNEVVTNLLKAEFGKIPQLWIGANDEYNPAIDPKRPFYWSTTGELMEYNNWGGINPDNNGGNEHCAAMDTDFKWKDAPCDMKMGYICQCTNAECVQWGAC